MVVEAVVVVVTVIVVVSCIVLKVMTLYRSPSSSYLPSPPLRSSPSLPPFSHSIYLPSYPSPSLFPLLYITRPPSSGQTTLPPSLFILSSFPLLLHLPMRDHRYSCHSPRRLLLTCCITSPLVLSLAVNCPVTPLLSSCY